MSDQLIRGDVSAVKSSVNARFKENRVKAGN
jgi:hypothetical protein